MRRDLLPWVAMCSIAVNACSQETLFIQAGEGDVVVVVEAERGNATKTYLISGTNEVPRDSFQAYVIRRSSLFDSSGGPLDPSIMPQPRLSGSAPPAGSCRRCISASGDDLWVSPGDRCPLPETAEIFAPGGQEPDLSLSRGVVLDWPGECHCPLEAAIEANETPLHPRVLTGDWPIADVARTSSTTLVFVAGSWLYRRVGDAVPEPVFELSGPIDTLQSRPQGGALLSFENDSIQTQFRMISRDGQIESEFLADFSEALPSVLSRTLLLIARRVHPFIETCDLESGMNCMSILPDGVKANMLGRAFGVVAEDRGSGKLVVSDNYGVLIFERAVLAEEVSEVITTETTSRSVSGHVELRDGSVVPFRFYSRFLPESGGVLPEITAMTFLTTGELMLSATSSRVYEVADVAAALRGDLQVRDRGPGRADRIAELGQGRLLLMTDYGNEVVSVETWEPIPGLVPPELQRMRETPHGRYGWQREGPLLERRGASWEVVMGSPRRPEIVSFLADPSGELHALDGTGSLWSLGTDYVFGASTQLALPPGTVLAATEVQAGREWWISGAGPGDCPGGRNPWLTVVSRTGGAPRQVEIPGSHRCQLLHGLTPLTDDRILALTQDRLPLLFHGLEGTIEVTVDWDDPVTSFVEQEPNLRCISAVLRSNSKFVFASGGQGYGFVSGCADAFIRVNAQTGHAERISINRPGGTNQLYDEDPFGTIDATCGDKAAILTIGHERHTYEAGVVHELRPGTAGLEWRLNETNQRAAALRARFSAQVRGLTASGDTQLALFLDSFHFVGGRERFVLKGIDGFLSVRPTPDGFLIGSWGGTAYFLPKQ